MFGDKIIPSQTSARDFCPAIFIDNLHWRWSREYAKTLYGWLLRKFQWRCFHYKSRWHIILCETIKHVNKEHIGAFNRAAYRKFVTVLKEKELKIYNLMKLTLKEKLVIETIFTDSSHYLLMEETNVGEKISQMLFSWQCSFPQQFQTLLSKKLF